VTRSGGVATVLGGAIGTVTVFFIQTGVVTTSLSGLYVQFFNSVTAPPSQEPGTISLKWSEQ
jgi:hypothetical protein